LLRVTEQVVFLLLESNSKNRIWIWVLPTLINIFCAEFLWRYSQGSATLFDNARF